MEAQTSSFYKALPEVLEGHAAQLLGFNSLTIPFSIIYGESHK